MGKKKKDIIGLTFKCVACDQRFAIGKKGIEEAFKRVQKHMLGNPTHLTFQPVNPPKGLTYVGGDDSDVKVVYDGGDKKAFFMKVQEACLASRGLMMPQLKLTL